MSRINEIGTVIIGLALGLSSGAAAADLVLVVSSKNSVTALTKNQVADIFLGRTNQFPNGMQALPIDQAEGSAAREAFYAGFAGKSVAQTKAYWSKIIFTGRGRPPKTVSNSLEMKKEVAQNPNVIGYIERNMVDGSVKVLSKRSGNRVIAPDDICCQEVLSASTKPPQSVFCQPLINPLSSHTGQYQWMLPSSLPEG